MQISAPSRAAARVIINHWLMRAGADRRIHCGSDERNGVLVTMTGGHVGAGTAHMASVALLALALCACAGNGAQKPEENVYPKEYRSDVVSLLRRKLEDPYGIREAFIAEPALKSLPSGSSRYVACIRFNAKDKDGQYQGAKEFAAYFFAGELTQVVDAGREMCGNAAYQPFPELEKYCREQVCKSPSDRPGF
jgi:hypothetical protein